LGGFSEKHEIETWYLAMPWLRLLVAGLLARRPLFVPRSVHVGFIVDKVALGQVFSEFFISPAVSFHLGFPYSIYYLGDKK
jgi:hypothetical protein